MDGENINPKEKGGRPRECRSAGDYNRWDDGNWDGVTLIEQIVSIYNNQGYMTEVLAASIRSPMHIVKCAEAGDDVCTCPLTSILGLLKHPLTDLGLQQFLKDAERMKRENIYFNQSNKLKLF